MRLLALASVASIPLVLSGCAARRVSLEPEPPRGQMLGRPGRAGVVIAARRGAPDTGTADIAADLSRRTGFGLVIASGFSAGPDSGEQYERQVLAVARGRVLFYVEILATGQPAAAGRIEVATVGIDRDHALQLKALFELTRDAYVRGNREAPRLDILVEPADRLLHASGSAKREGILRWPERALQIELPRAARVEFRELYASILADFLGQAVSLRPLR